MNTDHKIKTYPQLARAIAKVRRAGRTVVMVTGCYDIMHLGHLIFFNYAKKYGSVLIVALGSDDTIHAYKGPSRPIHSEVVRSRLCAGFEVVDYVTICHEPLVNFNMDHAKLIDLIKPDYYVVPKTDKKLAYKKKLVESAGGTLIACNRIPPNHIKGGISTSQIIERSKGI